MSTSIKVKMKTDLTGYRPGLVAGTEGVTAGPSPLGDRFVRVQFPTLSTYLDVLWQSLEIVDEAYLKKLEAKMRSATDVVYYVGPRGGFRGLTFFYFDEDLGKRSEMTSMDRVEADELVDRFRSYGVPVRHEKS